MRREKPEQVLVSWLEAAERVGDEATSVWRSSPAEAALGPLLAAADGDLEAWLGHRDHLVLPSARRDLVGLLSRRLTAACVQVLAPERLALDATSGTPGDPPLEADAMAWRERFATYPVLADVMTRVLLHWRTHVHEMLARLTTDRPLLAPSFFHGQTPGALLGVRGDLGDLHGGGRSVAVLQFEGERRVVYKPKDLRITQQVQELCAFLNARGLPLPLHVREVCCRDGYTWEEFVPAALCRDASEVERFYFRMGMLVRLFQVLEARDLWLDNLVAAGEHPVFVDLEMVLQPRRRRPEEPPASRLARERVQESVAPLGILAAALPIAAGLPAEDVGALTPPRAFMSPLRYVPILASLTGDERPSRDGHVLWTHEAYAPTLMGEPVKAVTYLDPLIEGYRAMNAQLRTSGRELLGAESPLSRMAGLPVRYIHRDTWTCYQLIRAGLDPALLTRQERRDAAFEPLLRVAQTHPEPEAECAAVRVELDALHALDVPYFLCHTDGSALLGPNGGLVWQDFFEGNALTRARQRLRDLDTFDLARQEQLFRSTLATGQQQAGSL